MLKDLTEAEILSLAKNGDDEALNFIISKYRYVAQALASKWSNTPIEPEDLVQEGSIGILAAIKSYDAAKGAAFSSYCYTCVYNSIQTALRKVNRQKDVPLNNVVPLEEEFVDTKASMLSAEDAFLAQESVSMLIQQLDSNLSLLENEVLRLYIAGCSYNEIGQRLGKTQKAIDNAMQRIRKKLKEVSF